MNKLITALCLSVFLSIGVFAQNQTPNDNEEYNKNETYVGFSHQRGDKSIESNYNGFEVGYTRNVHRYFGVKGTFTAGFSKEEIRFDVLVPPAGGVIETDLKQQKYTFMGGVQVKDNASQKRFKPFGHALAGAAVTRAKNDNFRCVSGNCGSNTFFPTNTFTETRFTLAVGGGLDVKINDKIDLRAIQVDYNPIFFSGYTQNNVRFGVGIVIK